MKKGLLVLVIFATLVWLSAIPVGASPTQTEIDNAIANGLAWLASVQNTDGSWGAGGYSLGDTAAALLAFENEGHFPGGNTIYSPNVEAALDFIFSKAIIAMISPQPAGNPDADGDEIGVYFSLMSPAYETGMCVMAIVASNAGDRIVTTGQCIGWRYLDVVSDVIDWWAYGQSDAASNGVPQQVIAVVDPGRGGWRYEPYDNSAGWSDNSVSQWPVLGMIAAEQWGLYAPNWVKDELEYWVNYIQNSNGGSGYTAPDDWVNMGKTGGLLAQMYWLGDRVDTSLRAQNAVGYIEQNWHSFENKGDSYAMFAVFKGLALMEVKTLPNALPDGDWWGDYCQCLVDRQTPSGQWGPDGYDEWLSTGWYITILQATILPVDVVIHLPDCAFADARTGVYDAGNAGYDVDVTYSVQRFQVDGTLKLFRDGVLEATVPITGFQGSATYTHHVVPEAPGTYIWDAQLDVVAADGTAARARDTASINVHESPKVGDIPDQPGPFIRFDLDEYLIYSGALPVAWSAFAPPGWIVDIDGNNEVTVVAPPDAAAPGVITFTATVTCAPGVVSSDSDGATFTAATSTAMSNLVIASGVIQPQGTAIIPGIWVGPGMNFMTMLVFWRGSDMDLTAISPAGQRIDRDWIEANPDSGITYNEEETFDEIVVPEPMEGEWQAEIFGSNIHEGGEVFNFSATVFSPIFVEFASEFKIRYNINEPINVGIYLAEGDPDTGLVPIPRASVGGTVVRPDGGTEQLTLYDDGAHNDNLPDDGIYFNSYPATNMKGKYALYMLVQGRINEGEPDEQDISRQIAASLNVDDPFIIDHLTPAPGSEVRNIPRPEISAAVQGTAAYLDTIEMTLDGNVVAHQHDRINHIVSYTPDALLPPGVHNVTLRVTDIEGYSVQAPPWSFTSVYDPISIDTESLTPEPGSTVPSHIPRPEISAAILGPELNIDRDSIELVVDGVKAPHFYDPGARTVSYVPPEVLPNGQHSVTLRVKDILGNLHEETWSFETLIPLILQGTYYYILDTTLKLEFNRHVDPGKTCFSGIGMEIDNSGEMDMQLSDGQGLKAIIDPDDPDAVLIDVQRAIPVTMSLAIAAFITCKSDDIDLVLGAGAFRDPYDGESLPADVPLKIMAHGYVLGKAGDVSGDDKLTSYDAALILRSTVEGRTVFPVYPAALEISSLLAAYGYSSDVMTGLADVSGNGEISSYDAALILWQGVGVPVSPGRFTTERVRICSLNVCKYAAQPAAGIVPLQMEVSVDLDDVSRVYSADIVMTYDPQILVLADISGASPHWLLEYKDAAGRIRISMAGASEATASAPLAILRFSMDRHAGLLDSISRLRISELTLNDGFPKTIIQNLPEDCALLQNYPNPFNPETWIPYRLSGQANVTITIYNLNGQVVRRLELGDRMPGYYISQERAAYWDGRNESGEYVSSGVYFYQLHAGAYTSVRKMIIRL